MLYRIKLKKRKKVDGEWWLATTVKPVRALDRAFKTGSVGGILYDVVKAVETTSGTYDGLPVIRLKLRVPSDRVERAGMDLCLSEIGIGLLDQDSTQLLGEQRTWHTRKRS
jgi:hypothetical protein